MLMQDASFSVLNLQQNVCNSVVVLALFSMLATTWSGTRRRRNFSQNVGYEKSSANKQTFKVCKIVKYTYLYHLLPVKVVTWRIVSCRGAECERYLYIHCSLNVMSFLAMNMLRKLRENGCFSWIEFVWSLMSTALAPIPSVLKKKKFGIAHSILVSMTHLFHFLKPVYFGSVRVKVENQSSTTWTQSRSRIVEL